MSEAKVVSLSGKPVQGDKERELVEFFAQKVRGYAEDYGHLPETIAWAMWGSDGGNGTDWATVFYADPPKSQIEAQATAAGFLLTKGV